MLRKAVLTLTPLVIIGAGIYFFVSFGHAKSIPVAENEGVHKVQQAFPSIEPSPSSSASAKGVGNSSEQTTVVDPGQLIDDKSLGVFAKSYQEKMKKDLGPEESGLQTALTKKYGEHAPFFLNDSDGTYAQGILQGKNGQDKWWLAAKLSPGKWIIVTDGYSYANCRDIAGYHFPTSMVPVCWGNNTLISR